MRWNDEIEVSFFQKYHRNELNFLSIQCHLKFCNAAGEWNRSICMRIRSDCSHCSFYGEVFDCGGPNLPQIPLGYWTALLQWSRTKTTPLSNCFQEFKLNNGWNANGEVDPFKAAQYSKMLRTCSNIVLKVLLQRVIFSMDVCAFWTDYYLGVRWLLFDVPCTR